MSDWAMWLAVGLGLAAVAARRPAGAAALVTAQTLLVAVGALAAAPGRSGDYALAAALLAVRALAVSAIVVAGVRRAREARPHDDEVGALGRVAGAVALVLLVVSLLPSFGLESASAEDAAGAMLAIALALVVSRRATVFAVLAFLVAENAIAVAAMSGHGALPLVVELGIAFDLVLLIAVATVVQRRILDAFGTTDSAALRRIRD